MRAPPHPRPSATESTLAPRSWRTLATRSRCCSPGSLARSGVKVLLGLGTLILPHPNPNSGGAHCGNAPGPHCRWWPARAARGMVRFASVLSQIPFGSPRVPLPPSLRLQSGSQSQTKWEAEVASRGDGRGRKYVAWEGGQGGPGAVCEDTHLTYWREWRGVTQLPPRGRKRVGPALARGVCIPSTLALRHC